MATAIEVDAEAFSPESYRLDVPTLDGRRAAKCSLTFSGNAKLDRTSADDVELMSAARLGNEVLLLVRGEVAKKSFTKPKDDDEIDFAFTVRITSVEAAERA